MALTKIQTAGITDDAVTAAAIADGTVIAAEIGADAVGASELADDAVASANIIDGAIVNADINASAAISGSKISGGTITSFASTGIDDNADALAITISSAELVGIGITSPEAKLHVQTATAGVVAPHGNADEFVIENSGSAGMSFLSPAGNEQFIMFGDVDDNDIGSISYNHYYNYMALKANAIETMQIKAGNIVMTGIGGIGNFLASMGDDAVTSITPNCNRGIIFVGSNSTHFGAGAFRCESGSQEAYILLNSSGTLAFGTGALATGTSGTDGKLNVNPASDGKIYFNNRLGGGAAVWYTIVGAMW